MNEAITLCCCILCGFAYRIRGGGWFTFPNDFLPRAIWGLSLAISYALLKGQSASIYVIFAMPFLAYLTMTIPHGYCQSGGTYKSPQSKWPSIIVPELTQTEWDSCSSNFRSFYDSSEMFFVALLRALIVFSWPVYAEPKKAIIAVFALAFMQAASYFAGWKIPFSLGKSLAANSMCWPEFLTGISWAIAMALS